MSKSASPPLDLRHVFARPWEGEAVVWRAWWLRLVPGPKTFKFRTEIVNKTTHSWDVLDTTTFPDGTVWQREMHCEQLALDRLTLTADDMPGGAEVQVRSDGLDFSPYVIRTPVFGPLRVPLRYFDIARLEDDTTIVDTIELRVHRVRVGGLTIRVHPTTADGENT